MRRMYPGRVRNGRKGVFARLLSTGEHWLETDPRRLLGNDNGADFSAAFRRVSARLQRSFKGSPIAVALQKSAREFIKYEAAGLRLRTSDGSVGGDVEMRRQARAIASFAPYAETVIAEWGEDCEALFARVAELVPGNDGERDGVSYRARLIDLAGTLDFLDELLELILGWHQEPYSVRPGGRIAGRVKNNLLAISRLSEEEARRRPGRLVLPSASKLSVADAVARYFGGTPLVTLLAAKVPVHISQKKLFESGVIEARIGHGKSQLLENFVGMLLSLPDPPAMVLMDSQGDLIASISRLKVFAPGGRLAKRLIVVDPRDPVAMNIFDVPLKRMAGYGRIKEIQLRNRARALVERIFTSLLSAEMTQTQGLVERFLADVMLTMPGATMQTLRDILREPEAFMEEIAKVGGDAADFLSNEFMSGQYRPTRRQLLRRVWGILQSPLRDMVCAPETRLDVGLELQRGAIIIVDTSKEYLEADGSALFGKFMLAAIEMAVHERAALPASKRRPTIVLIDESHEYFGTAGEVEDLIITARKYKVGVFFAFQKHDQLPAGMEGVVGGQVGTKLIGAVSSKDAGKLADDMGLPAECMTRLRQDKRKSEWMLHVRGVTDSAVKVEIPIGSLNKSPRMSEREWEQVLARNRARYGAPEVTVQEPAVKLVLDDGGDDWRS